MAYVIDKSFHPMPSETVAHAKYSVGHFIAWLEKQPADKEYCWIDTGSCLFAQYGMECGHPKETAYNDALDNMHEAGSRELMLGFGVACISPKTFGAALERARKAAASQP